MWIAQHHSDKTAFWAGSTLHMVRYRSLCISIIQAAIMPIYPLVLANFPSLYPFLSIFIEISSALLEKNPRL